MGEKFKELVEEINKLTEETDIKKVVEDFEMTEEEASQNVDTWIKEVIESLEKLDKKKLPYLLHYLYISENKIKFMLFCIVLEIKYKELPFITNLENIDLTKEKYIMLSRVLTRVASNSYNGIANCMYLILLNNDEDGSLLKDDDRKLLIDGINKKLPLLRKYIKDKKDDEEASTSLEILLDVACFINDEKTIKELESFKDIELPVTPALFLIKAEVANNLEISKKNMDKLLEDRGSTYALFRLLERIGKQEIVPEGKITMEDIALEKMIDWLAYPSELGDLPATIELVDILEKENLEYYIYKFTAKEGELTENGYMIGIAGGFEKDKLTTEDTGTTFSTFETIGPNYKKQAEKIINLIEVEWREKLK